MIVHSDKIKKWLVDLNGLWIRSIRNYWGIPGKVLQEIWRYSIWTTTQYGSIAGWATWGLAVPVPLLLSELNHSCRGPTSHLMEVFIIVIPMKPTPVLHPQGWGPSISLLPFPLLGRRSPQTVGPRSKGVCTGLHSSPVEGTWFGDRDSAIFSSFLKGKLETPFDKRMTQTMFRYWLISWDVWHQYWFI